MANGIGENICVSLSIACKPFCYNTVRTTVVVHCVYTQLRFHVLRHNFTPHATRFWIFSHSRATCLRHTARRKSLQLDDVSSTDIFVAVRAFIPPRDVAPDLCRHKRIVRIHRTSRYHWTGDKTKNLFSFVGVPDLRGFFFFLLFFFSPNYFRATRMRWCRPAVLTTSPRCVRKFEFFTRSLHS